MRLALRPEARSGLMASTCSGGSDAALQVEGAVMSLSAWERQTLDSIGNGLAESDPKLATLLTTFARLASGEEMPAAEEISQASWSSVRRSLRNRRRSRWGGLSWAAACTAPAARPAADKTATSHAPAPGGWTMTSPAGAAGRGCDKIAAGDEARL